MATTQGTGAGRPRITRGSSRERVLKAAAALFARHGYAGTSISAIVDASGVRPSSIYWEFKNKEGVFSAVLEDVTTRWLKESSRGISRAMREGDRGDFLKPYFQYMAKALRERPEFLRLMFVVALERPDGDDESLELLRRRRRRATDGIVRLFTATELLPADIDPERARDIARFAMATFDGAFAASQIDGPDADLDRLLELLHRALVQLGRD